MPRGEFVAVKQSGTPAWLVNPEQVRVESICYLKAGSLVLHLGEESDYYARVLSNSGKVVWVHKSGLEGEKIPPLFWVIMKSAYRASKKKILSAFGIAATIIVFGAESFK